MIYRFLQKRDLFNDAGFTLIEVIVGLIILSVLAAMIFNATGGGVWRTAEGVGECRAVFELQGEMERVVGIYKKGLEDGGGKIDLAAFRNSVLADPDISHIDTGQTGYVEESGGTFSMAPPASTTKLFLITLIQDNQRIGSIFSE